MDNEKLMYLIQKIDNRGETLEKNVASLNTNVHSLDKKLAEANVEHRHMRQMLTDADARVNMHDEDIIDLKSAADEGRGSIKTLKWMLGVGVTILAGALAGVAGFFSK